MARRKSDGSTSYLVIGMLAMLILVLAYVVIMKPTFIQQPSQFPATPPSGQLPTAKTSCDDYNLATEYTNYFGAANMQTFANTCHNVNGTWTAASDEVSCHMPSTIDFDCDQPAAVSIEYLCNYLHGNFVCSDTTKFIGCLCHISAPTSPLPAPEAQTYTCGWKDQVWGQQCSGTCPGSQICSTMGTTTCACHDTGGQTQQEGNLFLSSLTWNGAMGALDGADAKCQNMAYYANLSGSWVAVMSAPFVNALDRLPDHAFYKMDGTLVANSKNDLLDGSILSPINIDEKGIQHPTDDFNVWTGTTQAGVNSGFNCHNWGWVSANGTLGDPTATGSNWVDVSVGDCAQNQRIYCARMN
jgi:hypothetical protein